MVCLQNLNSAFILVINLLTIVQDATLKPLFFKMDLKRDLYKWYSEKLLSHLTVGDLIILCVTRALTHALFHLKNSYLLSNCCAILLNLAPHISLLHPFTSERIVGVFIHLGKRFFTLNQIKYQIHPNSSNATERNLTADEITMPVDDSDFAKNVESTVRVILSIISNSIRYAFIYLMFLIS